jgi:hypothetical protein
MKSPATIPLLRLVLLGAALLVAGCMNTTAPPAPTVVPTAVPETTGIPGTTEPVSCGLSKCHGIDVTCATNPPEACTMEYQLGDRCRKYLRCESSGGTCTLVKDAGFNTCKACVEKCQLRAGDNTLTAMSCEETC